jgi:drug/metabolite transporter (DMT)-like permease
VRRPPSFLLPKDGGPDRAVRGILFMCLAVAVLPMLNIGAKYLSTEYPATQITWARYTGHLIFFLVLFLPTRRARLFVTTRPLIQVIRSVLLFTATTMYFIALRDISVATATAISFTMPLMIVLLSIPLLGERVGVERWVAVVVGFIGAMIIIRPGLGVTHWAGFLILAAAGCNTIYQILTRALAGHDPAATSIVYSAMVGTVAGGLIVAANPVVPHSAFDWAVFCSLGIFGGTGHFLIVKAYESAEASVVSPFHYGQLVGATLYGYLAFGDFPDRWTWVGAAIIVASGLYVTRREAERAPA